ncbi:hypothetical protein [Limnohabitans parvus]|uniref:hypothetical protein n=1 Tax=Limnohabitans parvus TaxID=540061 RepID=UPI0011B21A34|nr:hypothetical protein [Limnohabitans parvus]
MFVGGFFNEYWEKNVNAYLNENSDYKACASMADLYEMINILSCACNDVKNNHNHFNCDRYDCDWYELAIEGAHDSGYDICNLENDEDWRAATKIVEKHLNVCSVSG